MALADLLATIPYVVWHQVSVEDDKSSGLVLRIPFRADMANYVGSFHAGALYTLAETTAGVIADRTLPDDKAFILLRSAEINYTSRPQGDVKARAKLDSVAAKKARKAFAKTRRADISVFVTMMDETAKPVFNGNFNYALRPRQP